MLTIHKWGTELLLEPDPGLPRGVSKEKIDELLKSADTEKGSVMVVAEILGNTVKAAAPAILSEVVPVVGGVVSAMQHGAAAISTYQHLNHIIHLNYEKCTCRCCDEVTLYAITKKSSKLARRGARAVLAGVPFANLGITLGEKIKGGYKMIRGTRKVNRRKFACILWITAKEGCPLAKDIVNELLGSPAKMMKAFSHYAGILAIAEKLSSK